MMLKVLTYLFTAKLKDINRNPVNYHLFSLPEICCCWKLCCILIFLAAALLALASSAFFDSIDLTVSWHAANSCSRRSNFVFHVATSSLSCSICSALALLQENMLYYLNIKHETTNRCASCMQSLLLLKRHKFTNLISIKVFIFLKNHNFLYCFYTNWFEIHGNILLE